ncbi:MAG: hypothetical protein ABI047_13285, partial [Jatrophihabitantaceae bacterium]
MPRRNLPARHGVARKPGTAGRNQAAGSSDSGQQRAGEQVQWWRGVEYRVRAVSGSAPTGSATAARTSAAGDSARPYRCPGCDQLLPAGLGHLVAWPADDLDASDRRHWH